MFSCWRGDGMFLSTLFLSVPCGNQSSEKLDFGSECQERALAARFEDHGSATKRNDGSQLVAHTLRVGSRALPLSEEPCDTQRRGRRKTETRCRRRSGYMEAGASSDDSTISVAVPIRTVPDIFRSFSLSVRGDGRGPRRCPGSGTFRTPERDIPNGRF